MAGLAGGTVEQEYRSTGVQAKPDAKSRPSREVFGVGVFGVFCEGILVHACHAGDPVTLAVRDSASTAYHVGIHPLIPGLYL